MIKYTLLIALVLLDTSSNSSIVNAVRLKIRQSDQANAEGVTEGDSDDALEAARAIM